MDVCHYEKSNPQSYPSCQHWVLQPAWQDMSIWYNYGMNAMKVTNHLLIELKAHSQDETYTRHHYPDQEIVSKEVAGPRGEPTTINLLSGDKY